jgi:hypothetical protein
MCKSGAVTIDEVVALSQGLACHRTINVDQFRLQFFMGESISDANLRTKTGTGHR